MEFDSALASALHLKAVTCPDPRVAILQDLTFCEWLCGGGESLWGYLPYKIRAETEKMWGLSIKSRYCANKAVNDWSGDVVEEAVKALCILRGWTVYPKEPYTGKVTKITPDIELDHAIIECKTQSYYTTGSAWEKYAFSPFKYSDVTEVSGKPAWIICFAKAEEYLVKEYFAPTTYRQAHLYLDAMWNIHWCRGTDFIRWIIS